MLLCCIMAFLLFACLGSLLTFSDAAGCTEADSDSCTDWSTNASSFIQVKDVRSKVVIEKHLLMDDEQDSKKKEQSTIGLEEHDEIRDPQAAEKGKKEKRKEQIEQDRKKEKHDVKEAGQSTIGTVQKNKMQQRTAEVCSVLDLTILNASNLKKARWWRSRDPYVRVYVENRPGNRRETGAQSNTHTPVWNFNMHFLDHNPSDVLVFDVWDHDIGPDTLVGHVKVRFECNGADMKTKSLSFSKGDSKYGGILTVAYKSHPEQYIDKSELMAGKALQVYHGKTDLSEVNASHVATRP
mmetsp:Transcript_1953/g.3704  ORF Transcript_1953/g.3704 Transcript_1953/m.3704 type:complete len:296 (-) Transcript_1953:36-923(-)